MDSVANRRSGPAIALGVALAAFVLLLLGGRSATASGSNPVATASASPLYWKNYRQPAKIEPTRININYSTGFAWATGLDQWLGWGTRRAVASGTLHLNTCRPFCAAGNYKSYEGRVTLFKIRHCGDQRRYLDIKIKRVHQPSVTWGSDCRGAQIKAP
jgi:hypothetical protein